SLRELLGTGPTVAAMSVRNVLTRRQLVSLAGAAGAAYLAACGRTARSSGLAGTTAAEAAATATAAASCVLTPAKTEGPYFVDEHLNRSDIRTDPSDGSVQPGVPLRLRFHVYRADASCAPVQGAQVDVWHAGAGGTYSDEAA